MSPPEQGYGRRGGGVRGCHGLTPDNGTMGPPGRTLVEGRAGRGSEGTYRVQSGLDNVQRHGCAVPRLDYPLTHIGAHQSLVHHEFPFDFVGSNGGQVDVYRGAEGRLRANGAIPVFVGLDEAQVGQRGRRRRRGRRWWRRGKLPLVQVHIWQVVAHVVQAITPLGLVSVPELPFVIFAAAVASFWGVMGGTANVSDWRAAGQWRG